MKSHGLSGFFDQFSDEYRIKSIHLAVCLGAGIFGYSFLTLMHVIRRSAEVVFVGDVSAIVILLLSFALLLLKKYEDAVSVTIASYIIALFFQNVINVRTDLFFTPLTQIYVSIVVLIIGMIGLSYFSTHLGQFFTYYGASSVLLAVQVALIVHGADAASMSQDERRRFATNLIVPLFDFLSAGFLDFFLLHYFRRIRSSLESKHLSAEKEKERLEEAVALRTAELSKTSHNLQQFVSVSSRDMTEHLRIMMSFMQLVERKAEKEYSGDKELNRYAEFAVESGRRLGRVINGLLEYVREDKDAGIIESVDTGRALERALADLRQFAEENSATVNFGDLPVVRGDKQKIRSLFYHLVYNGIKFHRDSVAPVVTVTAETTDKDAVFAVSDNGMGIEAAYMPQVFQLFQRLQDRGEYPGSGIGLALAKKIVENYGGKIWVESKAGEGSTFRFTLPLDRPAPDNGNKD